MSELYLEDFAVGQRFTSGTRAVTAEEIKSFAGSFDPQPFHTDEAAAAQSFFQGLAASGWHTAAITMSLLVKSGMPIAGGLIGAGGASALTRAAAMPAESCAARTAWRDRGATTRRSSRSRRAKARGASCTNTPCASIPSLLCEIGRAHV